MDLPKIGWKGWTLSGIGVVEFNEALGRIGNAQTFYGFYWLWDRVMTAIFGVHWADTNGYRLLCLLVFVGCMWGVARSAKDEARKSALAETDKRKKIVEAETAKQERIARLPTLLRFEVNLQAELNEFSDYIARLEDALAAFSESSSFWDEDQTIPKPLYVALGTNHGKFGAGFAYEAKLFDLPHLIGLNNAEPQVEHLPYDKYNPGLKTVDIYRPSSNAAFLAARAADRLVAGQYIEALRTVRNTQNSRLNAARSEINAHLKAFQAKP